VVEAAKSGPAYVMPSAPYRASLEGARVAARSCSRPSAPIANTELDRTTTYPKMLQSLAEWVPDAAIRRKILQDTPIRLFGFAGS
jgi:hypothetical protein